MEKKTFRGLMILSLTLLIAATAIAWPSFLADAKSLSVSQAEPATLGLTGLQFSNQAIFGAAISFFWIFTYLIGFVGLFMFRTWVEACRWWLPF